DYYLVTSNCQRLADLAISLTIQVNTSIGTTPVVLARDKDLPKAQKDLGPFVGDASLQNEIRTRLQDVSRLLAKADHSRLLKTVDDLNARLEKAVFSRTVLKVLAFRFGEMWPRLVVSCRNHDWTAAGALVSQAVAAWDEACRRAPAL